jgi:ketosteroid isomerase-like protein
MKSLFVHTLLCASLTGVVSLFSSAQATAHQTEKDKQAEEEVRKLNAEEVEAFRHPDTKTMERLWSDDLVVTNPLNRFVTKQQVLGMVQSGFLLIPGYERQIEYVRVYGDTVIVAGSETVVWGGKMPNAGKTEHLRFTGIWMKQGGRWQQVARHANIVPPQ